MFDPKTAEHLDREFEERGKRWAECMLGRLRTSLLGIPLIWPGTREQAETIVHALASEAADENDREHLIAVMQAGARRAWRDMVETVHDRRASVRQA